MVGLSGGSDSVALLHLLVQLRSSWGLKLYAIHVDHQLRLESSRDAEWVRALAKQFDLPIFIERQDVRRRCRQAGWSLEDGARRIRYQCFLEAATRYSTSVIALAHTADDQAETVLMRLLRGSGLTGLGGIPIKRLLTEPSTNRDNEWPDHSQGMWVVRPLLHVWRRQLLDYLSQEGLAYREDASNRDLRFVRNRIRHQLLPILERDYNPNVKVALTQLAEQCRCDSNYLQESAQRQWKRLIVSANLEHVCFSLKRFARQGKALQRQLVRQMIQRLQGDLRQFEFRHWLELERLFTERPPGTIVDLPGGLRFSRQRECLVASRKNPPGKQL